MTFDVGDRVQFERDRGEVETTARYNALPDGCSDRRSPRFGLSGPFTCGKRDLENGHLACVLSAVVN